MILSFVGTRMHVIDYTFNVNICFINLNFFFEYSIKIVGGLGSQLFIQSATSLHIFPHSVVLTEVLFT